MSPSMRRVRARSSAVDIACPRSYEQNAERTCLTAGAVTPFEEYVEDVKRRLVVVSVLVLSASCSSASTAKTVPSSSTTGIDRPDAAAVLRAAAKRSLESDDVRLQETMIVRNSEVALMAGYADLRKGSLRIYVGPGTKSSSYPTYETRFVDGWNYVSIDRALPRPRTLAVRARWVAFRNCYVHALPIPGFNTAPGLLLQQLDAFLTKPVVGARFAGPSANKRAEVEFALPTLGCSPKKKHLDVRWMASIDSSGRIADITTGARSSSQIRFMLDYSDNIPGIDAPPSHQVQRLAPTDDLYSKPPFPVCCSSA
jgi:hypothetical protein